MSVAKFPIAIDELRSETATSLMEKLVEWPSNSSLSRIMAVLGKGGVYEAFIPQGSRCGVISARDALKAHNVETTKPSSLMSFVPVLPKNVTLAEVARLMADYRMRSVPISDGRRIIGQVNCASLLKKLKGKTDPELRITSIATKNPITINAETSVSTARDLMIRKRIDHLPVIHDRRLVGVITSTDILSRIATPERVGSKSINPERNFDFHARDVMDINPLTCSPETTVGQALQVMLSGLKTNVLVTQWEELQGIATQRDFMSLLAEVESDPEAPIAMIGLPEDPFEAEAVKRKFKRTVNQLQMVYPDIIEARTIIKSKFTKPGKERSRYEVTVHIRTSRNPYSYSESGWDLPAIYDLITDRLKRLMTQKRKRLKVHGRLSSEPS